MASVSRASIKSSLRQSNANYFDNLADSVATLTDSNTFTDFIATADDKGLQIGTAGISGLAASLQTTGTIAIADIVYKLENIVQYQLMLRH